ncbi:hypothetical protein COL922a_000040 [Colletotrichum nupharicola]|nr:hypothetical protein COL922a_000040 [Colletotrichum nupharicola]
MEAEYEGETEPVYDYVMDSNHKTRASVWWGTRLSNAYFIGILSAASQVPGVDVLGETYLNRARLTFNRNLSKTEYAIMDPQNTNRFPGALLNNFTEPVQLDNGRFTKLPKPNEAGIDANVPLNESYGTIQPLMGPLSCNKATIAAQYLCSVPKQKSVG